MDASWWNGEPGALFSDRDWEPRPRRDDYDIEPDREADSESGHDDAIPRPEVTE